MKRIRYSKYVPDPAGDMSIEDLLSALSDYLLQSGFQNYMYYDLPGDEQTLDDLRRAIEQALLEGELLDEEMRERMRQMQMDGTLDELIEQLLERMEQEDYITVDEPHDPSRQPSMGGQAGESQQAKFEITDKSLDFLGFKTLRNLLGSLGRSSFGSHDTAYLATGIEADGWSKSYEFGDVLNLDVNETLKNSLARTGSISVPLDLDYGDLMVRQAEYRSSCATVLMLDCSHSMILYGEDRFTPAKKVALALTHLIRTQFPGDTLKVVLFHDSAEEIPLATLATAQVGPYHTNTAEGLKLARRLLLAQKKDMRQIIMITDGKPSALTLPNGQIYKNSFGLDTTVIAQTIREVANCRRAGIMINTFMLARDRMLVEFVKRVSEISKGKAYFTSTMTLGQFILMDFLKRKTRKVS
jgi:Ca-activated chloride channel family protein